MDDASVTTLLSLIVSCAILVAIVVGFRTMHRDMGILHHGMGTLHHGLGILDRRLRSLEESTNNLVERLTNLNRSVGMLLRMSVPRVADSSASGG